MMAILALILHGLAAVALLGAITHQAFGQWRKAAASKTATAKAATGALETSEPGTGFARRYIAVSPRPFASVIAGLYLVVTLLGAVIYPTYRLDVRPAFEEMDLPWAVGLFELKEHWGAIGLLALPLYLQVWRDEAQGYRRARTAITLLLAGIVWFDFLAGHLLNNLRGL